MTGRPTRRSAADRPRARRIGVDGHVLTGKFQGSRTWLVNVISRAAAADPETTYVVYSDDPGQARLLVDGPNVEHRRIPVRSPIPRLLAYWPVAMVAHRLDLLLTQYMSPLLFPRRQVVVVHDILFQTHPWFFPPVMRRRNRLLTRLSATRARGVITVSQYSREQIVRAYRLPAERVAIVPNGVAELPAETPRGEPSPAGAPVGSPVATPYALFVGRLEPRKNLAQLLDAFALVRDERAALVVVGRADGERPETLARLAAAPRVVHLTGVPDAELVRLYRHASVTVMPSLGEGFGIPVIEALQHGCPVISADGTSLPEAGGEVAVYYDPRAADAVATLAGLLDRAFAGQLAFDREAARKHLRQFDWNRSADRFVRFVDVISPRLTSSVS